MTTFCYGTQGKGRELHFTPSPLHSCQSRSRHKVGDEGPVVGLPAARDGRGGAPTSARASMAPHVLCMCCACAVHAISLETVALKNASVSTSARCSRMTPSTSPYIRKQYVPLCIVCPIDAPVEGRGWKLEGEGKHTPYANDVRGKHEAREAGSQGARSQQHEASDMNCCCLSIQASTSNVG